MDVTLLRMDTSLITISGITLYFISLIIIGFISSKNESRDAFMVAERKVGPIWSGISIVATWFDGPLLFTFITLGFASFYGVIWVCTGATLGLLFYVVGAPKIRKLTSELGSYSYPELSYQLFDKKTGLLISFLTFIVFFSLVVLMLVVGAQLLEALGNIPYTYSVLLMGIVSAAYLLLGGFKASIITDVFQMTILMILCCILLIFAEAPTHLNFPPLEDLWGELKVGFGSIFIFVFAVMFSSDGFSRVIASKSPVSARKASFITIVLFTLIGLFFGIWGLAIADINPALEASDAPVYLFTEMLPVYLHPFALIALFGVLMSSIDTYAIVAAQSLINDGFVRLGLLKKKMNTQENYSAMG